MSKLEELRESFSPLLDNELDADQRAAVEADLANSADALRELHDHKKLNAWYAELPPVKAPARFEDAVMKKIHPEAPGKWYERKTFLYGAPALAAAVLALAVGLPYFTASAPGAPDALAQDVVPSEQVAPSTGAKPEEIAAKSAPATPDIAEAVPSATPMASSAEPDTTASAPPLLARPAPPPASVNGMSAEAPMQPGVPVGFRFTSMYKAYNVPDATGTRAVIGGHLFYRRNMMWHEAGYDSSQPTPVEIGSEAWEAMLKKAPYLEEAVKLGPLVAAPVDGVWYAFHSLRAQ